MKYRVFFNFGLECSVAVNAKNEDEAIEKASKEVELLTIADCSIYNYDINDIEEE